MLNKNAQTLVKALRSGNYKQADGRLRNGDFYCCLGIGCEIYTRFGWKKGDSLMGHYTFMKEEAVLPKVVRDWLDFTYDNGSFTLNDKVIEFLSSKDYKISDDDEEANMTSLSKLNDMGVDFDTIASIIEMEPEGLFVN